MLPPVGDGTTPDEGGRPTASRRTHDSQSAITAASTARPFIYTERTIARLIQTELRSGRLHEGVIFPGQASDSP